MKYIGFGLVGVDGILIIIGNLMPNPPSVSLSIYIY